MMPLPLQRIPLHGGSRDGFGHGLEEYGAPAKVDGALAEKLGELKLRLAVSLLVTTVSWIPREDLPMWHVCKT